MSETKSILETSIRADTLDTTIDILLVAGKESKLHLGKDGLKTAIVDPANVMMHDLNIRTSAFESTPSGSFTVGTNLSKLQDYTSKANGDQTVDLSFIPETRMLDVSYNGYDIDMACIDPDSIRQEPDIPDLDLPNHFTVQASDLKDRLEMCTMASDHVYIECVADADEVRIYAEGDTDDVTTKLTADDMDNFRIREDTVSMYSLDYLVKDGERTPLFSAVPSGDVTVQVGDEFPMWMDYEYADGNAEVRTMMAPRIDTS